MINVDALGEALKKIGCWVDTPRETTVKNKHYKKDKEMAELANSQPDLHDTGVVHEAKEEITEVFENPQLYPFGFEIFFHTYNNKQRKQIDRALHVTWFAFKNRIPCYYRELVKLDKQMRRHVIGAAWTDMGDMKADEVGELFVDTLAREITEPGSSEIAQYALDHADEVVDEMRQDVDKAKEVTENGDSSSNPELADLASDISA
jgi:hypothetical protein